jgi:hypothetical protein
MRKLLVAVGLFVVVSSAQGQFCPGVAPWVFDDVQASDSACPAITWMALNNISLGCQLLGPLDRNYCPNDNVTRKQMALFMNRLGTIRVQEVDTGPGLTGGPITLTGTIGLAATQLLPTTACANGQVPQWNGSKWACAATGGTGTVTSVAGGIGIVASPSPITGSGTLNVAPSYQLPQGCSNGQVAKSNGSGGWTCAADANGGGTVTSITAGSGLLGGTITSSGTIAVDPVSAPLYGNYFFNGGNSFGGLAALGTLDNQSLWLFVNHQTVVRYQPTTTADGPNIVGGYFGNSVEASSAGQTIAGGGSANQTNSTSSSLTTVGGGGKNTASGQFAATVSGGYGNTASGGYATVVGGQFNTASGDDATVGGGYGNQAIGDGSFAAGNQAIAGGTGSFVWADNSFFDFDPSNGPGGWGGNRSNTFSVRATGGVWFLTGIDSFGHPLNGAGVEVLPGNGAWQTYSDRNGKDNIEAVDPEAVLTKLVAIPIATWRWQGEDQRFRHMGPMAQDFYAAYHLGANDTHIVTVDAEGVALAAIQGLYAELRERDARITEQQREIAEAQREIVELRERVSATESLRGELAALRSALAELQHPQASVAAK